MMKVAPATDRRIDSCQTELVIDHQLVARCRAAIARCVRHYSGRPLLDRERIRWRTAECALYAVINRASNH